MGWEREGRTRRSRASALLCAVSLRSISFGVNSFSAAIESAIRHRERDSTRWRLDRIGAERGTLGKSSEISLAV